MQETWVQSLDWEDRLEKEKAIHSSVLSWEIPWIAEPGRLQSMGSQRVGPDWVTKPPQHTYVSVILSICLIFSVCFKVALSLVAGFIWNEALNLAFCLFPYFPILCANCSSSFKSIQWVLLHLCTSGVPCLNMDLWCLPDWHFFSPFILWCLCHSFGLSSLV